MLSILIASYSLMPAAAQDEAAETSAKPLWEFGVGAAGVVFPHYRGSREYTVLATPLPLVIYRGDFLKVSRGGARAELIDHPRLELNISGGGSPPVDSDEDELRRGMPDLDPTFEIGPRLSWLFTDPAQRAQYSLRAHLPVYGVAATDLSDFETIGLLIQPRLTWRQSWSLPARDRDWSYSLSAGPIWATGEYHDYFYSVASRFATSDRPAFDAEGGYGGFGAGATLSHRRGRLRVGASFSVDYLEGAAFEDSPLVATDQAYVGALFLAWTLWESETRAPKPDPDEP